jgi:hypothetical protein
VLWSDIKSTNLIKNIENYLFSLTEGNPILHNDENDLTIQKMQCFARIQMLTKSQRKRDNLEFDLKVIKAELSLLLNKTNEIMELQDFLRKYLTIKTTFQQLETEVKKYLYAVNLRNSSENQGFYARSSSILKEQRQDLVNTNHMTTMLDENSKSCMQGECCTEAVSAKSQQKIFKQEKKVYVGGEITCMFLHQDEGKLIYCIGQREAVLQNVHSQKTLRRLSYRFSYFHSIVEQPTSERQLLASVYGETLCLHLLKPLTLSIAKNYPGFVKSLYIWLRKDTLIELSECHTRVLDCTHEIIQCLNEKKWKRAIHIQWAKRLNKDHIVVTVCRFIQVYQVDNCYNLNKTLQITCIKETTLLDIVSIEEDTTVLFLTEYDKQTQVQWVDWQNNVLLKRIMINQLFKPLSIIRCQDYCVSVVGNTGGVMVLDLIHNQENLYMQDFGKINGCASLIKSENLFVMNTTVNNSTFLLYIGAQ